MPRFRTTTNPRPTRKSSLSQQFLQKYPGSRYEESVMNQLVNGVLRQAGLERSVRRCGQSHRQRSRRRGRAHRRRLGHPAPLQPRRSRRREEARQGGELRKARHRRDSHACQARHLTDDQFATGQGRQAFARRTAAWACLFPPAGFPKFGERAAARHQGNAIARSDRSLRSRRGAAAIESQQRSSRRFREMRRNPRRPAGSLQANGRPGKRCEVNIQDRS